MLAERHMTPESTPSTQLWPGTGDPRATIDALLQDRERLC